MSSKKTYSKAALISLITGCVTASSFTVFFVPISRLLPFRALQVFALIAILSGIYGMTVILQNRSLKKGIIIALIGIISGAAYYAVPVFFLLSSKTVSYRVAARDDLEHIAGALAEYHLKHGSYPDEDNGLMALYPTLIREMPRDPWGNFYQYEIPDDGHPYRLYSLGRDGVESRDDIEYMPSRT